MIAVKLDTTYFISFETKLDACGIGFGFDYMEDLNMSGLISRPATISHFRAIRGNYFELNNKNRSVLK